MQKLEYILCHGSGNRFVMFDAIATDLEAIISTGFIQAVCRNHSSDGVLLLTRYDKSHLAMRMFNTDGSEAEMCGNGIRCVARLADERYLHCESFTLYSGGKPYPITREVPLLEGVPTYGVDIAITTSTPDFCTTEECFVGKVIEELSPDIEFTYLNLGNPHIVALTKSVDYSLLSSLGERVKSLKAIFPNGVNISFIEHLGPQRIFVATFERGVGLTASCGTAMTASSTASVLLGLCTEGESIEVRNRGGLVRCLTRLEPSITTQLVGNATFESYGESSPEGEILSQQPLEEEQRAWARVIESINN